MCVSTGESAAMEALGDPPDRLCSLNWNEAICMLFVFVSKQQKVGYYISKSWLHLCPTMSVTNYVSTWCLSAAGQLKKKKKRLMLRKCTDPRCNFQPTPACACVRRRLVGGSWWRVSPPAEMKWSTRNYKHSAAARAGSERCQRLRDEITVGKKMASGKGGKTAVIDWNNLK